MRLLRLPKRVFDADQDAHRQNIRTLEDFMSVQGQYRDDAFWRQVGTSLVTRWYVAGMGNNTAMGTGAPAIGTLIAMPLITPRGGTLDRIAFDVTVAGGAGSVARVGLYDSSAEGNLYPNKLLLDGGSQGTNATGQMVSTISRTLRPNTLYWAVYNAGVAAPTITALAIGGCLPIMGISGAFGAAPGIGWTVASVFGALPDPYPAGATVFTGGGPIPAVAVRYSA